MQRPSIATLTAALLLVGAPAAEAQIFQPGTQPRGQDGGLEEAIQPSRSCRSCHGGFDDDGDHEPYDSWRGSMMGSAGRDPVALAAIAVAEADAPQAADFCLRCHTPTAWFEGRSSLPEYAASNPESPHRLLPDTSSGLSAQRDGIGCMVCHRMVEPPEASMISNAQLVLADGDQAEVRRGPYTYAPGEEPRHETALEPFLSSSALCGSCHDIHNPLHDGFRLEDGELVATGRPFAIERTYSEWLGSAFAERGQSCQSCHMPEVEARGAHEGVTRPEMSRHDLAGGSVWVARALAEMVRENDAAAALHLEASALRAGEMLRQAATLEVREHALEGDRARLTVRVTNETGHKLPTGYPEGRRMWLEVEVLDETGRVVAGSGRYDESSSTLIEDAQLRTYEAKLGQGREEGFHFVLNDTLHADTRIPPEGFTPPPGSDTMPLGRDYGEPGAMRHWDETSYELPGLCGQGALRLRVRLRYQSTTREYIEFLRDRAPVSSDPALGGRSWGAVAYDAWRTHGGDAPFDMETVEVALGPAPRPCAPPPLDAGPLDGGADGGEGDGGVVDAGTDAGIVEVGGGGGCGCRATGAGGGERAGLGALLLTAIGVALRRRRR